MSEVLDGLPKPVRLKGRKAMPAKAALLAGAAPEAEAAAIVADAADSAGEPAAPQSIPPIEEPIMETVNTTSNTATDTAQDVAADMQARATAAFTKGTEMTADLTAFHKGNLDAMIESSKVLAAGMQDLGRSVVEDAKSAAETATGDIKAMAAVKSPTELFQLQGDIMRRNLDAMVARTSQNAEVMMKLANDMFAPLSSRASVAMERFNKAA